MCQGTKQELPSDLALPIFSLMQKASVWFSPGRACDKHPPGKSLVNMCHDVYGSIYLRKGQTWVPKKALNGKESDRI